MSDLMQIMVRRWGRVVCALCFFVQVATYADDLPATMLQELKSVQVPTQSLGVFVQELATDGRVPPTVPLIDWQGSVAMKPASVMKLVTSYAALQLLGPAYRWKTQVLMTGYLEGDVLHGDLVFRGGGDPKLVLEDFWLLLRQIRASGIRRIQGNVVVDRSWMQPQAYDPAEFDGSPDRPYNAGADGLLLNYNVLSVQLHDEAAGLRVTSDALLPLQGSIQVRRVAGACGEWRDKLTPYFRLVNHQLSLVLTGDYARSCGDHGWLLQPYTLTPDAFFEVFFRQLWKETGGEFSGEVQPAGPVDDDAAVLPGGMKLVTEWLSPPLAEVLRDMNKFSNNVMARQVLLTLDNSVAQRGRTSAHAGRRVQEWLSGLLMPVSGQASGQVAEPGGQDKGDAGQDGKNAGIVIDNGSGLSRSARIGANQLGRMLVHAFASPVMPEFVSSLPVLGVDGTMAKRLHFQAIAGNAHIKGGTLDDVRAIAGYVLAASGKRYVLVCLVNDKNAELTAAAQNALLVWLYQHG